MTRQEELTASHKHDHHHPHHTPHDDPTHPHRHHGPTHHMQTYYPQWFIVAGTIGICLVLLAWFLVSL
jgi:hypothetical protein